MLSGGHLETKQKLRGLWSCTPGVQRVPQDWKVGGGLEIVPQPHDLLQATKRAAEGIPEEVTMAPHAGGWGGREAKTSLNLGARD